MYSRNIYIIKTIIDVFFQYGQLDDSREIPIAQECSIYWTFNINVMYTNVIYTSTLAK